MVDASKHLLTGIHKLIVSRNQEVLLKVQMKETTPHLTVWTHRTLPKAFYEEADTRCRGQRRL